MTPETSMIGDPIVRSAIVTKRSAARMTNTPRDICAEVRSLRRRAAVVGLVLCGVWPAIADSARLGFEEGNGVDIENMAEVWDQEGAEWPRWGTYDPASTFAVDYSAWQRFTADYADPKSSRGALDFVYVANRGLGYLSNYIFALEKVPVSMLSRDEQLAYWLNLHNAGAVQTTASSLPLRDDTTREIVLGKKWREKSLSVEGEKLSLVDIARRIVMRQWKDPRVLYGIYLPGQGAPGLPVTPFTGATVWKMLDDRARDYVNSERATEFHDGQLHVSAFYFWDKWLFPNESAVIDHLRSFAEPPLKAKLTDVQKVTATYFKWRTNGFNSGYDRTQDRQAGS